MSHISYALVVHQVSGRIVYKTRNKTGGDVNPTIKNGTILPFDDVCYIGETLQPDYVIGRISLDDHENINYETQRWNSDTEQLRDATPEEIASYKDVVNTADATDALSASKEVMALITVLAPLHEMSVEALTDAVIAQLKNEEA
tara:strand:- start:53 stop:484 length:432 start_codon:yes stop_codon:yes gene_type:complete